MNDKLQATLIEVKELTSYNQHMEVTLVIADYICDKHCNSKDAKLLKEVLVAIDGEYQTYGYMSEDLIQRRNEIVKMFKKFLTSYELKLLTEAM